ncbi:hypothetical protein ACXX83_08990 [Pseudomonas sp. GNP012]
MPEKISDTLVEIYVTQVLRPQLRALGWSTRQRTMVTNDVCLRLYSMLALWHDVAFRRTALLCGIEEATFYTPSEAALDVRALVVVAIRNSLIEDLGTDKPVTQELRRPRPPITDSDMASITRAAVEYFHSVDLSEFHTSSKAPSESIIFSTLRSEYPNAWYALAHIANSSAVEIAYELPGNPNRETPSPDNFHNDKCSFMIVTRSGIDPMFDEELISQLNDIKNGLMRVFYTDSFKSLTRNTQKLYQVIDFILKHGAAFVTSNYYFDPTYASRRHPLLRPCHTYSDIIMSVRLSNKAGLSQRHSEVLTSLEKGQP